MGNRQPLTIMEKQQVYQAKLVGKTLPEIAEMVTCSVSCARKWWRVGRDGGLAGLHHKRCGRGAGGLLSQFDPAIGRRAVVIKEGHPKWGAARVLIELADEPSLQGLKLPAASTLAAYFQTVCPQLLRRKKKRRPVSHQPGAAHGVHEIWQLDHQEGIRLDNGEVATISNLRDPFAAVIIMSEVTVVTTAKYWRKLTLAEVRAVLRAGFTEWQTMPQVVQTDNEPGLGGSPNADFPGLLTLWLVGLGIKHQLIRPGCPTDQAQVERTHQTLDGFALHPLALTDEITLQTSLQKERKIHNECFPSRAADCQRLPPLVAHPQLHSRPRPYQQEWEYDLFNLQYVADYLATFTFERRVNVSGQVSLGHICYYLGTKYRGQLVRARFDAQTHEWLFTDRESNTELTRKQPPNFTVDHFTGLDKPSQSPTSAIQLAFPAFF